MKRRRSHRGRRSFHASCRRWSRFASSFDLATDSSISRHVAPHSVDVERHPTPEGDPRVESGILRSPSCFTSLLVNIRSFNAEHAAELSARVLCYSPHFIFVNESWLNPSTPEAILPGYAVISRRDRIDFGNDRAGSGVIARRDCACLVMGARGRRRSF